MIRRIKLIGKLKHKHKMIESVWPGKRLFMIRVRNLIKDSRSGSRMPSGKLSCNRTRGIKQ